MHQIQYYRKYANCINNVQLVLSHVIHTRGYTLCIMQWDIIYIFSNIYYMWWVYYVGKYIYTYTLHTNM
jgi:hypothetical protein